MTSEGSRPAPSGRGAAVLTVGTELLLGIGLDTNSQEIAAALTASGYPVRESRSVADDVDAISAAIIGLTDTHDVVVVTGGLGPTHDDVTREAAAQALGVTLRQDEVLADALRALGVVHTHDAAREQMLRQALVLEGATVLPPEHGTAPGQLVRVGDALLALLPGPPHEMRPMLTTLLSRIPSGPAPRLARLSCAAVTESDAQVTAARALSGHPGIGLTVLAGTGVVSVVLHARDVGSIAFDSATTDVAAALGDACFSTTGETLAASVVRRARDCGATLATAESCTGGGVATALTDVPGASAVFRGGIVAYADDVKTAELDVPQDLITAHGAVSLEVAGAMAVGAVRTLQATHAVAVTGVAGPDGGSARKPVGTVCFGTAHESEVDTEVRRFRGDREAVRRRAVSFALASLLARLGE